MDKIQELQQLLKEKNIAAYIIPTSDFHNSEYIIDYFKSRELLSGFTGSAGTLLVTQTNALLWTDGRYYIQAQKELENTSIELMKQGLPSTLTITQYINEKLGKNDVLAFDGRLMTASSVIKMEKELNPNININSNVDLIDEIWQNRPKMPFSILYKLDTYFSGKEFSEKLSDIRKKMKEKNTNVHVLSRLEDQAWLYNLRGNDVKHTPVFLANTIITHDSCILFINPNK